MNKQIFKAQVGAVNRYKLSVYKASTGELVRESGWSENLIPTRGLELCLSGGVHTNSNLRCLIGTGSNPPAMSDTALQNKFAQTEGTVPFSIARQWQTSVAPYWYKATAVYRFAAGTFNNTNITEVGTEQYYSAGALFSRALVLDANGNPAAVTILADEYLDVTVDKYLIFPETSGSFNQLIDGVPTAFGYTIRPLGMSNANWGDNSNFTAPLIQPGAAENQNYSVGYSGASFNLPTSSVMVGTQNGRFGNTTGSPAYVPGSLKRKIRFNMGLTQGNAAGGINGMHFDVSCFQWQMLLDQPVPKVATKTYYIEFEITMANAAVPE